MAEEYVIPTPSAGSSAEPTEARYVQLLVEGHRRDLAAEEDVEPRAAWLAAELVDHHCYRLCKGVDAVVDLVRDCDRDAPGIRKGAEPQWIGPRRQRLRVKCDRVGQQELALKPEVKDVTPGGALRMTEPLG